MRATTAEAQANANEQKAVANAASRPRERPAGRSQRDEAKQQRDEVKALADQLQRTLYAAHMNLAHNAWDAGGIERVQDLLNQHRPKPGETDLRGFEWHYLHRLCHAELLTLKGHSGGGPDAVAFSPDGKRLAFGAWDGKASGGGDQGLRYTDRPGIADLQGAHRQSQQRGL